MLKKELFMPMGFFKKEAYTGSMKGMRYRICRGEDGFEVSVYPEPYCYEATPEERKIKAVFPFTEEGREQVVDWINEQYQINLDVWAAAE